MMSADIQNQSIVVEEQWVRDTSTQGAGGSAGWGSNPLHDQTFNHEATGEHKDDEDWVYVDYVAAEIKYTDLHISIPEAQTQLHG